MRESNVLRACVDYLQFQQNQGKLMFLRLNSGTLFVPNRGGGNRRVNLCPEGTADLLVIRKTAFFCVSCGFTRMILSVLWVETKHKGKQTESQRLFQERVEAQGCRYLIVTDVDQLRDVLE